MFLQHESQFIDMQKIESFTANPDHSPNIDLIMDSGRTYKLFYRKQDQLIEAINLIKQSREKD